MQLLQHLWSLLNSQFFASFLSAAFGAWFGAWAAQRNAVAAKQEEHLEAQLRHANTAITLTGSIVNTAASLKRQHVKKLKEDYDRQKATFQEAQRASAKGDGPNEVRIQADFETLERVEVPIARLLVAVFDQLTLPARPLLAAPALARGVESLNEFIEYRNQLIYEFRQKGQHHGLPLLQFLFGLRDSSGNVDNRYGSAIDCLHGAADQCLFFGKLLAEDLMVHAERCRTRLKAVTGVDPPKITEIHFDTKEFAEVMPPDTEFAGWTSMIEIHKPGPPLSRWARFRRRVGL
jgi:hypothetical protein